MSKQTDKGKAGMLAGAVAGAGQAKIDRQLAEESARARTITLLPIDTIKLREQDTRPARAEQVLAIAESISAVGLLQPPAVDKAHRIVAGLNRLHACRLLLTPPAGRVAYLQALDEHDAELEPRIHDLPALNALPEPLVAGKVPVRVLVDLDAHLDPSAALAAEAAENTARRQYTPKEARELAQRLREAGYRESTGRPKAGEKALRPALEMVLGQSASTIRRLLGKKDAPKKGKPVSAIPDLKRLRKLSQKVAEHKLPAGTKLPAMRRAIELALQLAEELEAAEAEAKKYNL
jgi:ParB family transcriptional regulator, chromosome partitioning protein